MYKNGLGRYPTEAEATYWFTRMTHGVSRTSVAQSIVLSSPESQEYQRNMVLAQAMYLGLLETNPVAREVTAIDAEINANPAMRGPVIDRFLSVGGFEGVCR